jgi:Arc/MetJ family transcription regulator
MSSEGIDSLSASYTADVEVAVTEIRVNVDEEALAEAAEILGTETDEETVNAALLEMAERRKRRRAFEKLVEMAKTGQFDELLVKSNYRRP